MIRRLDKTLIDYLVIAISPAMIMTLLGSLVFFLLKVFYHGGHQGRLHFIFAAFVFAIVLVARIAIEEGRERACFSAIPLALVTLLALSVLAEGSSGLINLLIIAIIWWASDKLVWDCTLIDEQQRDSGRGLLEAVGLDRSPAVGTEPSGQLEGVTSHDEAATGWWQRHLQRRRRPHAPGVWVVYFSLAALPVFGIGQLFVPLANTADRQYAFRLLVVYVASGLGLLLSTSFLSLRRYLRQRTVEMPSAMANLWLSSGAVMIVALLAVVSIFPRPVGVLASADPAAEIASEDAPEDESETVGIRDGERKGSGVGQDSPHKDDSAAKPGDSEDSESSTSEGSDGESKQPSENGQQKESDDPPPDNAGKPGDQEEGEQEPSSAKGQPERGDTQSPPESGGFFAKLLQTIGTLLKYIFYAVLIVVVVVGFWRTRGEILQWLSGLIATIREFLAGLFGGKGESPVVQPEEEAAVKEPARQSFAAYSNPFAGGEAKGHTPDELVRYTFEALEAWAAEHGLQRPPEQTPHEFAHRLGKSSKRLAVDVQRLAELYSHVAYAPGGLSPQSVEPLATLWRHLQNEEKTASA